jgi:hypothetical protein
MQLSSPPYVPHVQPISVFLISEEKHEGLLQIVYRACLLELVDLFQFWSRKDKNKEYLGKFLSEFRTNGTSKSFKANQSKKQILYI